MSDKMRAAVRTEEGDFEIKEVGRPKPGPGEALIRIKACGICGSDLHGWKVRGGWVDQFWPVGSITGHEWSGIVEEVGSGVKDLEVGDRVGVEPLIGCGQCYWCRIGNWHLCPDLTRLRRPLMGGFAEYGKGPTYRFYKLPENVSYEDAALLDCISMGVHAANRSEVRLGNSVVVLGAGAIGLSTIAVAAAAGARVYCIGHHDFRLKAAKEVGAIEVFNRKEKDPKEDILRLTGGIGADIVMETVGGHAKTIQQGIELARRGGVIAILGVFSSPQEIDLNSFVLSEIDLIGVSSYSSWGSDSEFAMALDLISTGKINVKPFVTHRLPLQEINTAFETSVNRKSTKAIKVLVIP